MDTNVLIVIGTFTGLFIGLPGTALSILLLKDRKAVLQKPVEASQPRSSDVSNAEKCGCE